MMLMITVQSSKVINIIHLKIVWNLSWVINLAFWSSMSQNYTWTWNWHRMPSMHLNQISFRGNQQIMWKTYHLGFWNQVNRIVIIHISSLEALKSFRMERIYIFTPKKASFVQVLSNKRKISQTSFGEYSLHENLKINAIIMK